MIEKIFNRSDKKIIWRKLGEGKYRVTLKDRDKEFEKYSNYAMLMFGLTLIISLFGMWEKPTPFFDIAKQMRTLFIVSLVVLTVLLLSRFGSRLKERIFKLDILEKETIRFLGSLIEEHGLYIEKDGRLYSSVSFTFKLTKTGIEITAYTGGTGMVEEIRKLDGAFMDKFGMEIVSKRDEMNQVVYKLKRTGSRDRLIAPVPKSEKPGWMVPITKDMTWNMNASPHGLIAGTTGGGKTYFIFYLVSHFIRHDFSVYICDPKRSDLTVADKYFMYKNVYNEYSTGGIARSIRMVKEDMLRRYKQMEESDGDIGSNYISLGLKPIILLVDEFGGYLAACDRKLREEVLTNLKQIIFQGRQAGVFVILATQKPDKDTIPTNIRDQLGLRAVLGNMSDEGYRMVFGSNEGMEYKYKKSGEGYIHFDGLPSDMPVPFKAPLISDLNELLRETCLGDLNLPVRYPGDYDF